MTASQGGRPGRPGQRAAHWSCRPPRGEASTPRPGHRSPTSAASTDDIGTQAIGLAALGHRGTGTDLSPVAAVRATAEAAARGLRLPTAAADMCELPFPDGRFDVVACADNALPHLLAAEDVRAAPAAMHACWPVIAVPLFLFHLAYTKCHGLRA